MKTVTLVFAYNRKMHLEKTINALLHNTIKPEALWIIQDGPKEERDKRWNEVNQYINNLSYPCCKKIFSEKNKGLAKSIYDGVTEALSLYDAAIVLEDDCVTHPIFISTMIKALEKYKDEKKVFQVNGSSYPVELKENGSDAYFTHRIDTWGWATWKDRWDYMQMDYSVFTRVCSNPEAYQIFSECGKDFENYLLNNLYGRGNAWSPFWGLVVIEHEGLCLSLYESLVCNIGFDGSGTHSTAKVDYPQKVRDFDNCEELRLPDIIEEDKNAREYLKEYSAWTSREAKLSVYNDCLRLYVEVLKKGKTTNDILRIMGVKTIAIYGIGKMADFLIDDLQVQDTVKYIVLSKPSELVDYRGINVITPNKTIDVDAIIIIPEYDYEMIIHKLDEKKCIGIRDFLKIGEGL